MNRLPANLLPKFTDNTLTILSEYGSATGEMSISRMIDELRRMYGWKNFGTLDDTEDTFKAAGFSFRRVLDAHGYLRATYITL